MELLSTVVLMIVLAIAVRTDMLKQQIPNALTGTAACAGLVIETTHAGVPGMLASLAGIAVGGGFMLPFYALRGMGAGDVKLMGAVGSFLGPKAALLAAGAALVMGALLGLGRVAAHRFPRLNVTARKPVLPELESQAATPTTSVRKEKFPYALAIASGSLITLLVTK